MTGLRQERQPAAPRPAVIAWPHGTGRDPRRGHWIEATMRRVELPCVVDLAKRPGALESLSRILGQ
ncbi:hypothetical protein [Albidovulum sp.]|uniref:hypothetical protein n=1 Tax=Albidovulum sp. TaxID=1872424 RepID=UPI0039B8FEEC